MKPVTHTTSFQVDEFVKALKAFADQLAAINHQRSTASAELEDRPEGLEVIDFGRPVRLGKRWRWTVQHTYTIGGRRSPASAIFHSTVWVFVEAPTKIQSTCTPSFPNQHLLFTSLNYTTPDPGRTQPFVSVKNPSYLRCRKKASQSTAVWWRDDFVIKPAAMIKGNGSLLIDDSVRF